MFSRVPGGVEVSPRLRVDSPSTRTDRSPSLPPKLRPPVARSGIVVRSALIARLMASDSPVVTLVAPPGYGKTTLLAQWVDRLAPRVAWVSCEEADDDPAALWTAVAAAINAVAPIPAVAPRLLAANGGGIGVVPAFVAAVEPAGAPMTIVLDHVEHVTSSESHAAIAEFAMRVPPGWQLALASRDPLPIPTARLRAQGRLTELGPSELAMSAGEAAGLLAGADVVDPTAMTGDLLERTEGWPVGLYLAALAMQAGTPISDFAFGGDDRLVGDYLRSELLSQLTTAEVRFLLRTSVLDRLCGPLCDAVTGDTGSARTLEGLVSRNMLVVPLDRHRQWYRYHLLLREHLQAELRMQSQDESVALHSRAAAWHLANGMPEDAIRHAQAAGDADLVSKLTLDLMSPVWASGRMATVLGWMQWLEAHPSATHYAAVMANGALIYALLGRAAEAERWAEVAERHPPGDLSLPDGSTASGALHYLRANLARKGMASMRTEAQAAWVALGPGSPFRATMAHVEGMSYLLEGDLHDADTAFSGALELAVSQGNMPFVGLILAERSVVATARNDWASAEVLADSALRTVNEGGFDGYWTSALVFATAARSAAHRGDMPVARQLSRRAAQLRPLLTYALPVVAVQTLVELAHAYLGYADQEGAAAVLNQAAGILRRRPDLGTLPKTVAQLQARVGEIRAAPIGASSLTTAELRLLPLLPTHLSMREIGERLYISRNTVKSQLMSLYRKLGVSSRSEAVARADTLGLHT